VCAASVEGNDMELHLGRCRKVTEKPKPSITHRRQAAPVALPPSNAMVRP